MTTTTSDPKAEVEDAVKAYTEAFGAGDADKVISMVSDRCIRAEGENTFRDAVAAAHDAYDKLTVTSIDVQLDGDTAAVSYSVSEPALSQSGQTWTRESGKWHWDAC